MTVIAKSKLTKSLPTRQPRFNRTRYSELLLETLPAVIQSEAEFDRLATAMNKLAVKPRLSPEEDRLLDLL